MSTITIPVTTTPERSLQQRLDALLVANDIRFRRAQLKRDLKAGRQHGLQVIARPPEYVETMKVLDVLLAMPAIGPTKAHRVMRRCEMAMSKTLGGISTRQRRALIHAINDRNWNSASVSQAQAAA